MASFGTEYDLSPVIHQQAKMAAYGSSYKMSADPTPQKQEDSVGEENVNLENGDSKPETPSGPSFKDQFRAFSKFGDRESDGKTITLTQSDKWMKQAKVFGKSISTTDTGIYFKKLRSNKVSVVDYEKFLDDLAKAKKVEVKDMKKKMSSCGAPGHTGATSRTSDETLRRLTDTSRYTGTHKQRFDESGKGKGVSGRKDIPDGSGYVSGYNNKDTYDKNAA